MRIGKYVTNPGVIGAALGALSTAKRTREMPRDWRQIVVWIAWLSGLALAIGAVAKRDSDREFNEHLSQ